MLRGVDLSYANRITDYDKLASQVDFAILRAGYGELLSQKDKKFDEHYSELTKRGVPVGAYWYSYAVTPASAEREADICLQILDGKKFEYPIFFDIEESKHSMLSSIEFTDVVNAFCKKLESANYWVGVYSCKSMIERNLKNPKRYALWCAGINTLPHEDSTIYQYSWEGCGKKYGQPNGTIDLDISMVDYPAIIKKSHKNNF